MAKIYVFSILALSVFAIFFWMKEVGPTQYACDGGFLVFRDGAEFKIQIREEEFRASMDEKMKLVYSGKRAEHLPVRVTNGGVGGFVLEFKDGHSTQHCTRKR